MVEGDRVAECVRCGAEIGSSAKFCPECGAAQPPGGASRGAGDEPETAAISQPPGEGEEGLEPETTSLDRDPATAAMDTEPRSGALPAGPSPPAGPSSPPGGGNRSSAGTAGEMAARLGPALGAPGVVLAGISGLLGVALCLLVGLLLALVMPDSSFLGAGIEGTFSETLIQACGLTLASFRAVAREISLDVRFTPALLALVPILGCGAPAFVLAARTAGAPIRQRLLWGAAAGIPFAVGMLAIALIAGKVDAKDSSGTVEASSVGVFGLALLWGGLGGVGGTALALRRGATPSEASAAPRSGVGLWLALAFDALRPLAIGLAIAAVVGTGAIMIQTARDAGHVRLDDNGNRSFATAAADDLLFAVDNGVHYMALGAGSEFRNPVPGVFSDTATGTTGLPLPVTDVEAVTGEFEPSDFQDISTSGELTAAVTSQPRFRIFDYRHALPVWAFIALLALILVPVLLALYAGYAISRRVTPGTVPLGAAWGALVGPLWAVAMVVLNAMVDKTAFGVPFSYGAAEGGSVFLTFLIGGGVLGALGGAIAARSGSERGPAEPAVSAAPTSGG